MLFKIYYYIIAPWVFLFSKMSVTGADKIPQGRVLLCGNHTSLMDPIYIAVAMYSRRRFPCKFFAKKELSHIPLISALLSTLIIFVDRGKSDIRAIRETMELVRGGDKVVIFPEGTRVDSGESSQGKTGVSMISVKTQTPLLPVFVSRGKKPLWRFPKVDVVFGEAYQPVREPGTSVSENYRKIADNIMMKIDELDPNRSEAAVQ